MVWKRLSMPFSKNSGSYGQLGNWGRKRRSIPKKRLAIVLCLIVLGSIFAVSKNSLIPVVFGDYNTSFSHTRTPIFVDNQMNGPTTSGGPITFHNKGDGGAGVTGTTLSFSLTVSAPGDTIVVDVVGVGAFSSWTVTDSFFDTFTSKVTSLTGSGSGVTTEIYTSGQTIASGTDTITVATGGATRIYNAVGLDYSGVTGFGNTATDQNDNCCGNTGAGSSTITLTVSATTSFVQEIIGLNGFTGSLTFNTGSLQTVRDTPTFGSIAQATDKTGISGSSSLSFTWTEAPTQNCTGGAGPCFFSHSGLELLGGASLITNTQNVRWNYNSTCVTINKFIQFDYALGVAGRNNCSSADMAITKASFNLQTASGRMLEMVIGWAYTNPQLGGALSLSNVTFVLRSNGTLPSFSENYNPMNDPQARLVWSFCPTYICSPTGNQTIYIQHDNTKTIKQETFSNDIVIQGKAPDLDVGHSISFGAQAVLNFTGPTNFIEEYSSSAASNTSNSTASELQFGQDYYIVVMATWNTAISPFAGTFVRSQVFSAGAFGPNVGPMGIWSVPASCNDQINKAACGLGTVTPTFQFNPLDPSSWGNAIIKGLLWVFTVAIPQGLVIMSSVLVLAIRLAGNFIGGFFGQGTLGDSLANILTGIGSFLLQSGTVISWIVNILSAPITLIGILNSLLSTYFPGLGNFLHDAQGSVGPWLLLLGEIAIWFPSSYMIILIVFYFLLVIMNGLKGFFEWVHLTKWSSFALFDVFMIFLKAIIDGITWVLGRISIISPGHKLTKFPHLSPGPLPKISFSRDMAIFHDPTAWFLSVVGFFFTILWAATSASGLPGSTTAILNTLQPLTLAFFGISFMVLILVIPGWLLGKMMEQGLISEGDL